MYRVCFPINKPNPMWFYDKQIVPYWEGGKKMPFLLLLKVLFDAEWDCEWAWKNVYGMLFSVFFLLSFVVEQSMPLFTARLRCAGVKQMDGNTSSRRIRHWGVGERSRWKEWHRRWKSAGPSEAVARESMSHCNYLSVTSATESPSNRSVVPKHLANAQLTSTDVGTHWHLIPLPADRFIRQKERKRGRRDGNIQWNEDNCTYQQRSWC